jgi:uncharacterized protein
MAEVRARKTQTTVIDPQSPWKVTLRNWNWSYGYKTSASEWQALLARAKNGDPQAEWEVAERYADGCKDQRGKIIVRRSAAQAAPWFRRAAEHGNMFAQNTLGVLLGNGNGVRKNVEEALWWLKKVFRAGHSSVALNIAITYRENGNLESAFRWFQRGAEAGDGEALVQLGIHYYWGKGCRINPRAAVHCFRAATKSKNMSGSGKDDAFFFLGVAYQEGRGVRPSTPTAKQFFKQANIDGDHAAAAKMLSERQT